MGSTMARLDAENEAYVQAGHKISASIIGDLLRYAILCSMDVFSFKNDIELFVFGIFWILHIFICVVALLQAILHGATGGNSSLVQLMQAALDDLMKQMQGTCDWTLFSWFSKEPPAAWNWLDRNWPELIGNWTSRASTLVRVRA